MGGGDYHFKIQFLAAFLSAGSRCGHALTCEAESNTNGQTPNVGVFLWYLDVVQHFQTDPPR